MSIKYLAGRTFDVGEDTVEPGDELTQAQVDSIPWLEAFISAGYIYPVTPTKGYDSLPPHVFNAVQTRAEARVAIEAGSQGTTVTPVNAEAQDVVNNDHVSELAERQFKCDEQFAQHRHARPSAEERAAAAQADENAEKPVEVVQPSLTPPPTEEEAKEDADEPQEAQEDTPEDKPEEAQPEQPEAAFDPTDHTVGEVQEYLAEHPEDSERVLALESEGKNRKTLVGD